MIVTTIDIVLLLFLLTMAATLVWIRNLLAMTMLFGLYSLLCAGLFMVLDAPDVAFTEAAVGSGISTALMLATLALTGAAEEKRPTAPSHWPWFIAILTTAALIYGTYDIAALGDATAPQHVHVANRYIEQGLQETGVPNIVTAVLASYRGFDTLGEVTVIFTAGIGVLLLLLGRRHRPGAKADRDDD